LGAEKCLNLKRSLREYVGIEENLRKYIFQLTGISLRMARGGTILVHEGRIKEFQEKNPRGVCNKARENAKIKG